MAAACKVALITGAGRGIGHTIAQRLSSDAHCVLLDNRPEVVGLAVALGGPLGACVGMVADVGDETAVVDVLRQVTEEYGRLDIVVNNAGVSARSASNTVPSISDISLDEWDRLLRINLTSMFLVTKAALPLLRASEQGRVINISSRTARTYTGSAAAHYAVSKAGVIALTRQIAGEEARNGITANCIAAGSIRTAMTTADGEEGLAIRAARSVLGRVGEPEDIAAAVAFLASAEAGYITGATIDVNGGSLMV